MRKKRTYPVVVGCDPSSKRLVFFIIWPDGSLGCWPYELRNTSSERYTPETAREAKRVCEMILEVIGKQGARLYIEHPVVGKDVRSSIVQAYINGVVQAEFRAAGHRVEIVHPSTWKSTLGIKGNDGKPEVLAAMKEKHPRDVRLCGDDPDAIDAAALARHGDQAES